MRSLTPLLVLILALFGCKPPKLPPSKPTERIGGFISQTKDRVDEAVISQMLKDLHLHILQEETSGQMPTPEQLREYGKTTNRTLGQLLDQGIIALPEKLTRSGVWAYQKEASGNGKRWLIIQAGPTQVDTEEFNKLMGK